MTRLFAILVLLSAWHVTQAAEFTNSRAVTLEFAYPAEEITPTLAFYVVTNGDITVPLLSWPVSAVITNCAATNLVPALLTPPRCFFAVYASNEWGRGDFSEVLASMPPRQDSKLRLR